MSLKRNINYWLFRWDVPVNDARVRTALEYLWRQSTAYGAIREGHGFNRRLGLKIKTRALIQHDRCLRGFYEVA